VERADRASLIALPGAYTPTALQSTGPRLLDEETAHHFRVRRLVVGDMVRVTDGSGVIGTGPLTTLGKRSATVEVIEIRHEPEPPPVRLLVPVADRDRTLWLAEKSAEMGVREWTPLSWHRSRSVSPRGEGESFRARVRARMVAALIQSGGAWLPHLYEDMAGEKFVADQGGNDDGIALLLDANGPPLLAVLAPLLDRPSPDGEQPRIALALGPEGGLTEAEVAALVGAGFRSCSLGPRVLRFETAAIAALAVIGAAHTKDEPACSPVSQA